MKSIWKNSCFQWKDGSATSVPTDGSNEVEDNAASQKILDVFDVLLAGVEAVD